MRASRRLSPLLGLAVGAALVVLLAAPAAAQIGYEIEINYPTVVIDEGPNNGMTQPARAFTGGAGIGVKVLLGRYRNWDISIDNVSHNPNGLEPCDLAIRRLFPRTGGLPALAGGAYPAVAAAGETQGLFAWSKPDVRNGTNTAANRRQNRCGQGIIEFQTAVPRTTAAELAQDFNDLRTYLRAWETAPLLPAVARPAVGGAAPPALPGVGNISSTANGCNNVFTGGGAPNGCVLRFPYYPSRADAIAQTNPVANTYWYVVVPQADVGGGAHPLATQINLDIPLSYFATYPQLPAANTLLWEQFGAANNLWATTQHWDFGRTLTDNRKGFYRVIGYYGLALENRINAHAPMGAFRVGPAGVGGHWARVFPKNTINPNPKFDPCEMRHSFANVGKYLRRYYQGAGARITQLTNTVATDVMSANAPAHCSFVTSDVNRIPLRGRNKPVFEFRFAGNHACWELVRWLRVTALPAPTAAGGITTLTNACAAHVP